MNVLLLNGSPHEKGATYTALREVEKTLQENGIQTEVVQLGKGPIQGCTACLGCRKNGGICVFTDAVTALADQLEAADGFIVGSPVYYAGMNGTLKAAMDRLFYPKASRFRGKPAAAVVCARRGGCLSAFDDINRYFSVNCMPIVTSQYWNQVHGNSAQEVAQDAEGLQTMRTLGMNMAWLLRCIQAGKEAGIQPPTFEKILRTNFIR